MATSKRAPVTKDHELKETLVVDYITPGHDARGAATALFHRTRLLLIERERGRCWVSGMTALELKAPLEAHHYPVERSFAERWDWARFAKDCQAGQWGPYAKAFNWTSFFVGATMIDVPADESNPTDIAPAYRYLKVVDPYLFVDDMTVNGMLLGKEYHTVPGGSMHTVPYPVLLAVKYLSEGYKFSDTIIIHHEQELTMQIETTPEPTPATPTPVPAIPESEVGNGQPPPPM